MEELSSGYTPEIAANILRGYENQAIDPNAIQFDDLACIATALSVLGDEAQEFPRIYSMFAGNTSKKN